MISYWHHVGEYLCGDEYGQHECGVQDGVGVANPEAFEVGFHQNSSAIKNAATNSTPMVVSIFCNWVYGSRSGLLHSMVYFIYLPL